LSVEAANRKESLQTAGSKFIADLKKWGLKPVKASDHVFPPLQALVDQATA
jgi:hypothetical protein